MFDYLDKFKKLPQDIQEKISNPNKVKLISALENKYKVDLAVFTVKIAVSDVPINDLGIYIASDLGLAENKAKALEKDLKEQVFLDVADFLKMDLKGLGEKIVKDYLDSKNPKTEKNPQLSLPKLKVEKIEKKIPVSLPKTKSVKLLENTEEQILDFVIKPSLDIPPMPKKNDVYSRQIAEAISDISQVIEKENLISDRVELIKAREILRLYIRGIKSRPETRKILKESLNLEHKHVETILQATASAKKAITPAIKRQLFDVSAAKKNTSQVYNLSKILGHTDGAETRKLLKVDSALKVNKPVILDKAIAKNKVKKVEQKPVVEEDKKELVKPVVKDQAKPAPKEDPLKIVTAANPGKQKIHDISEVKIMNPIDELRYMDTKTFRRLGTTAKESVEKISSRFAALEKDDFEKKIAGVFAWRESPLNKLYIKMASMSAASSNSLEKLAEDMKNKKEDYLSPEELNAIIVLNRSLRF